MTSESTKRRLSANGDRKKTNAEGCKDLVMIQMELTILKLIWIFLKEIVADKLLAVTEPVLETTKATTALTIVSKEMCTTRSL